MQSIDEINAVIRPETGWVVELGQSPLDQSEFLRLYRWDAASGDRVFVCSLPRETPAGVICAFGSACGHYMRLGETSTGGLIAEDQVRLIVDLPAELLPACGLTAEQLAAAAQGALAQLQHPDDGAPIYLNDLQVQCLGAAVDAIPQAER